MAVSYVGNTFIAPPNTSSTGTTTYNVIVPPGVTAPAVILTTFVAGSGNAPPIAAPSGWLHVGGTTRVNVYSYAWTTGNPTSFAFTSAGTGCGYWTVGTIAYNGAVIDKVTTAANSQDSAAVTTSSPFDWVVSNYYVAQIAQADYPAATSSGTFATRRVYLFTTNPASEPGIYGFGWADTNGVVPQGNFSSGTITWSPATSQLSGWGTTSIAISGALTPSLPTNFAPTNGRFVDFTVDQGFSANYNNIDGSVCQAWQFRQKVAGASSYNYWNAGSAAFQSSTAWNPGNCAFTLPAGILSNASTYNWSFNTESSYETTLTSGFANDFTVIGQPPPSVAVTGPTGTITTATPTVTWTATAGGTATLTAWRVITYSSSTTTAPGFVRGQSAGLLDDSGTQSGATTTYTTGFLPNGTSVVSYVQVTQSGNQSSPWQATAYSTSYAVPNAPVLSSPGPTFDNNGAPVVALTLQCPPNTATVGSLTAVIYFTDANNPTLTPLRNTAVVTAGGGLVVIADYEATFGMARVYQARIVSSVDGPSPYSNAVSVVQTSAHWVLSDPINPTLFLILSRAGASSSSSTSISVPTTIEIDRARNQTIFRPFGKSTATVQYGDVYAPTFTLSFILQGYAQAAMYDALWSTTDTLLVRSTMGDSWYVDAGPTRPLDVLRAGDIDPLYVATLACTVTDSP